LVNPKKIITNAQARAGDLLVLTKPLGTGIITTALKRKIGPAKLIRKAIAVMKELNLAGAEVAEAGLVRAGTDITGYGLLGHLGSMCRASGVGAEIEISKVPLIDAQVIKLIEEDCIPGGTRENLKTAEAFTEFDGINSSGRYLVADAQTSGGMLLCVPERKLQAVLKILKKLRTPAAAIVGRIVRSAKPRIWVKR
jgi:selenide, water dikinase